MTDLVKHTEEPTGLRELREAGRSQVARQREINSIFRSLETAQWGSVQGSKLSEGSRYALARMCHVTRAEPTTDIDILGGTPYHNGNYYRRRAMNHPCYIKHEQRNILRDVEKREEYGVPEDVHAVYETIITRLTKLAHAQVEAGRLSLPDAMQMAVEVRAANWAGNKRKKKRKGQWDDQKRRYGKGTWYEIEDTIGVSDPDKTARTRSFRRAARDAFGLEHMGEQELLKAQKIIEADWEYVDDNGGQRQAPEQIVAGQGEPSAVIEPEPHEEPEPAPEAEVEPEVDMVRRRYFATLRAVGINNDEQRKAFQQKQGLPGSVTEWGPDHFEAAHQAIMQPLEASVTELCQQAGTTIEDISLQEIQKTKPEYARDWVDVREILKVRVARQQRLEESAGDSFEQGDLVDDAL